MAPAPADFTSSANSSNYINPAQPQVPIETPQTVAAPPQAAAVATSVGNSGHTEDTPADNLTLRSSAHSYTSTIVHPPISTTQGHATSRPNRPSTTTFAVEAQAPPTHSQTMRGRFAVWHPGHKAALQTTGAVFAILFFSLELWGMIDSLADEN